VRTLHQILHKDTLGYPGRDEATHGHTRTSTIGQLKPGLSCLMFYGVTENMFHNHRFHHNHDSRKHIFGMVKVGERGQIVIPKEAREIFDIKPGDTLMILGDEERGLVVVKAERFRKIAEEMLRIFERPPEEPPEE